MPTMADEVAKHPEEFAQALEDCLVFLDQIVAPYGQTPDPTWAPRAQKLLDQIAAIHD